MITEEPYFKSEKVGFEPAYGFPYPLSKRTH